MICLYHIWSTFAISLHDKQTQDSLAMSATSRYKKIFSTISGGRDDKLPSFLSPSADIVCSWPEQKKKFIVVLQLQIGNVVQENVTYSLWNYIRYANVRLLNNGNGLDVIFYCSVGERSWAPALLNNWN